MTTDYVLAPEHQRRYVYPSSYGSAAGAPVIGGKIYTYESNAHTTLKATYTSSVGSPPPLNTNPIVLDDSGECVIYWAFDEALGNVGANKYYVEFRDPNGVLLDSYDVYNGVPFPAGSTAEKSDLNNVVTNPQFSLNHFGKASYNVKNQSGGAYASAITSAGSCYVADDWIWTKSNANTTETVALIPFALDQVAVPNSPVQYLRWNVSAAGSAETYKSIYQYYSKVNTFAGQTVTIQFWARSSTANSLNVAIRQYFGAGGSADVVSSLITNTLTADWIRYSGTITVDGLGGKSIGTGGDDTTILEFDLPLNAAGGATIDICNVDMKVTSTLTNFQYETINIQETKTNRNWFGTPVGDSKNSYIPKASTIGWVAALAGSIGNATSGATLFASENAYALYAALYNNCDVGTCPVSTGRGASALADFNAAKTLTIPVIPGKFARSMAANPNVVQLGVNAGSDTSTAVLEHTHPYGGSLPVRTSGGDWEAGSVGVAAGGDYQSPHMGAAAGYSTQTSTSTGGAGSSFPLTNPLVYTYTYLKL